MRARFEKRCKHSRGATLIELLLVCLLFAFLIAATTKLYHIGEDQQRTARFYSDAQAKCREAIRRILRTARHGYGVESGLTTFNGGELPVSGPSQVIFTVPQPYSVNGRDHIRFYVQGGTLYGQRSDAGNAGEAITTGVTAFTVNYFRTTAAATGATRTATDGAPTDATEVQVTITINSGTAAVTRSAYVEMRNTSLGL